MTGPLRMTADDDLPPLPPLPPMDPGPWPPGPATAPEPDYTLAALGLDGDPVARVLWLRAELERAVDALTPQDRAELVQYGWPPAAGHLRAVA
ncbi:hypothetical protein [Micromonospora rubida]|uniref:hypothetical protein n=1 Tax=Micromonospora rubida TaxID=2697657 RepID=UPI0013773768|nr:hypothetical protein [Micromonospora rubida]NBE80345.1 hypothetical protein [Micromonospora rubida]